MELGKPSFSLGKPMFLKLGVWKTFIFLRKTYVFEGWSLENLHFPAAAGRAGAASLGFGPG